MVMIRVSPSGLDGKSGFFYGGQPHYPGAVLSVPERFAREMVALHKAELVVAQEPVKAPESVPLKGVLNVKQRSVSG